MTKIVFIREPSSNNIFFMGMKDEITRLVNDPTRMFDYFKGTFVIKLDAERPKAEYDKNLYENIDEGLLKSYLFLLNYTLITYTLKNQHLLKGHL